VTALGILVNVIFSTTRPDLEADIQCSKPDMLCWPPHSAVGVLLEAANIDLLGAVAPPAAACDEPRGRDNSTVIHRALSPQQQKHEWVTSRVLHKYCAVVLVPEQCTVLMY
jgi:hypothetical protein